MLDKKQVATAFGKKAKDYDTYARVQKYVGDHLLSLTIPLFSGHGPVVDLGTGSGFFLPKLKQAFPDNDLLAVDLSEGMVVHARQQHASLLMGSVVADAENLPFADNSVDLIYSSMAIQWCEDLQVLLKNLRRVVKPGGLIAISTLLPKTLFELKDSWQAVDGNAHVNRFLSAETLLSELSGFGSIAAFHCELVTAHYPDLKSLLHSIKGIGANTVIDGSRAMSKGQYKALMSAYEQYRTESGQLPASYEVCYFVLNVV
ncbi:malonyl-ACP O-methyltransferase BioC [Litoribacillus peritrichatus]|uniref:Malonyl-[acyl-carrier protein] O-methyltransferase n=1 Tax=Litoribacillus peritrichatus TaxID=718191 RepID=A0ABP7M042_9GAMM